MVYGRGSRDPLWGLVWDFSTLCPRSFLPDFLLIDLVHSGVCFFLMLHPCCSNARGILCGIHTPCMRSPFPAVHAKWSLVFLFVSNSYWPTKTDLSPAIITIVIFVVLSKLVISLLYYCWYKNYLFISGKLSTAQLCLAINTNLMH